MNDHLWNNGTRIVDKSDKCFPELVRKAMELVLHITDKEFMDQMASYFGPLLCNRINKKLDNAKSKYRSELTAKRRSNVFLCITLRLASHPLILF